MTIWISFGKNNDSAGHKLKTDDMLQISIAVEMHFSVC